MAIEFNRANSAQSLNNSAHLTRAGQDKSSSTSTQQAPQAAGGDQVQFSQGALELQSLTSNLRQLPEINQEKVQQLKLAIENGDYKVDTNRVANRMLDFEEQL